MRPDAVVVGGIGPKHLTQVGLAQDHDVVQALPTDRADQPLRMSILPRGSWCNRVIPDAHRHQTLGNGMTIGSTRVAYKMGRRLIPRGRLR
jgi:hypothetical protein